MGFRWFFAHQADQRVRWHGWRRLGGGVGEDMLIRTVKFATRLLPGGSLTRDLFFEHGECDGLCVRCAMLHPAKDARHVQGQVFLLQEPSHLDFGCGPFLIPIEQAKYERLTNAIDAAKGLLDRMRTSRTASGSIVTPAIFSATTVPVR